jgi:S-adenosylmethionine:tRNA ribosyltransferase-isomerase
MKTADFFFDLPAELIAQEPPKERGRSRLMVLDRESGQRLHRTVQDLGEFLEPGSVLVFNNSKVRKARLFGRPDTGGGQVEFLLLERRDSHIWLSMVRRAKRRRNNSCYSFPDGLCGEITGEEGELRLLRFDRPVDDAWLDLYGHIPLPPYIKRQDTAADSERYQTVYADPYGSAAAPTAGLHFTRELLGRLVEKGIECAFITLHVGLGTFLPVRAENIEDHVMHREWFFIDDETADRIEAARAQGRKITAAGTTSVRTLESAWEGNKLRRGEGETSIFIYPGYTFRAVDALFTNFHTPGSTLLMLVSAFAGRDLILDAYAEAVRERYRFFSYGDAMLLM